MDGSRRPVDVDVGVLSVLGVLWISCGCGCWCPRRPVDVDVGVLTKGKLSKNEVTTNKKLSAERIACIWIFVGRGSGLLLAVDLDFCHLWI